MILRLDGANTTLLLLQRGQDMPEIVHWGVRLPHGLSDGDLAVLRDRARPRNWMDDDIPAATLWPTVGVGLFQAPALSAHRGGLDWTSEFTVLETTKTGDGLTLSAHDATAKLALTIWLALHGDVLTMRTSLRNEGEGALTVDFLAAGVFVLPPSAPDLIVFGGHWGHEFDERHIDLPSGSHVIENRRGRTSHDRFPLLMAGTPGLGEERGCAWSVHLGWSGNHRTVAERLPDGALMVVTGEFFEPGETILPPGGSLHTPVAVAAWSDSGLSGVSRAHHSHVRTRVLSWPGGAMRPRPVTLNTWEGTYFAHDETRLMRQADAAAAIGIERFVLDDGWMPARDHDRAGLGDWTADKRKYPRGLAPLARHVVALGMEFGLWVEPEMANPDSDAVRGDPESVLRVAGRQVRTSRNQVVVDLTRAAVWARVHAALDALLRDLPIAYLKWDMNRELVAAGERASTRAQTLAVYALMDRLRADHPALEIESCASGGARADLGALARTHRVWASDCTDALDRLAIQQGLSRLLPPEIVGAHVSASPNHQTGRRHTLAFRAAVALFGHFGIELDPLVLDDAETAELRQWIALHKGLRPLLHGGRHVALDAIDGSRVTGVVSDDGARGAYLIAQHVSAARAIPAPLRLPGLSDATYRLIAPAPQACDFHKPSATHLALYAGGISANGAVLASAGFVPPPLVAESALILTATRR